MADVLVDAMRGRVSPWARVRVNLESGGGKWRAAGASYCNAAATLRVPSEH